MRFRICRSSDSCANFNKNPPCKNAIIVEELLELETEVDNPLIISSDGMREIEIYDSYRE